MSNPLLPRRRHQDIRVSLPEWLIEWSAVLARSRERNDALELPLESGESPVRICTAEDTVLFA